MIENSERATDALRGAATRRIELKGALSSVEIAAASPSAEPGWHVRLIDELEELSTALLQHVDEVEASDGLLAELSQLAPRLVNQVGVVRDEHPLLCRQVAEAIVQAKLGADASDLRAQVVEALSAIAYHRQRGADLVYEGYSIDIGGS